MMKTVSDLLIETRGNQSEVARMLNVRRETVRKYIDDKTGRYHRIIDGGLFTKRVGVYVNN